MNKQLFVTMEDDQSLVLKQKKWDYDGKGFDDKFVKGNYPRLQFKDGALVICDFEDVDDFILTIALEDGIDFQTGRFEGIKPVLYDIPEWNIKGYTVGEVLLEVYRRATAKYWVKDWPEYTKYLFNGDLNFKSE